MGNTGLDSIAAAARWLMWQRNQGYKLACKVAAAMVRVRAARANMVAPRFRNYHSLATSAYVCLCVLPRRELPLRCPALHTLPYSTLLCCPRDAALISFVCLSACCAPAHMRLYICNRAHMW